ncbi:hypothetical protein LSM04_003905 [Trypanosoma melophagium]|uniref:uncharacterized protein n=1 Tax=Trypanosoma melophagium TaxID=715481 RepID=UPI00351A0A5D|nr:hypothetical protein LSM04_003905 [Trypanosoma melophagium]
MLETSMERLQLRELAVPDIPQCIGDQDVAMQNLREDLDKAQNRLNQAQAESSMLKREIRDLRSLLAVYMSNSKEL